VRLLGVFFLLLGIVAGVVGTFSGCGALFSWNGRHEVRSEPLGDVATRTTLIPEAGRRYTLAIEVVFDRADLPREGGVIQVEAKMPLVATVKDAAGTKLAQVAGWLDPEEPPNVLYGQAAPEVRGRPPPELVVVRLVGPFTAASTAPLTVDVNLGPDRIGKAKIQSRRLVIHDDALPPAIRNAFIFSMGGGLSFLAGVILLVAAWLRRRAARRAKLVLQNG
jgi:hypothetical protein